LAGRHPVNDVAGGRVPFGSSVALLTEAWRFVLVRGLGSDSFSSSFVNDPSEGMLHGVGPAELEASYSVAADSAASSAGRERIKIMIPVDVLTPCRRRWTPLQRL
jgi:hypothetical protein